MPNLAKIFHSSRLIYCNNRLTMLMIRLTRMAEHIGEGNELVARMAEHHPDRILNTYWINPLETDYQMKMQLFFQNHKAVMLKMHQCWTKFDLTDDCVTYVVDFAEGKKLPIFFHLKDKRQVRKLMTLAKAHPQVTFILGHLIGAEEFQEEIPNIYFDLSCPVLHSEKMLKRIYTMFGASRLLLGSDAPYGKDNLTLAITQLREAGLTEKEVTAVCSENITGILENN